ncbi:hypothetical protein Rcae01_05539 [Novipirellula caenicola]|uniref:Uncharacterized protein n=2 Tax=Novipirellula caenicola TaxID=1536901 RepID=A0ABP9W0M4_9BACT
MQPHYDDASKRISRATIRESQILIQDAANVVEEPLRESLRLKKFEIPEGKIVDGNVVRLLLRPLVGCEDAVDLQLGLVDTVAAILQLSDSRAKMVKRHDSWAVYAVLIGSDMLCQSMITWLAHKAVRNKWSLIEDVLRP